MPSSYVIREMQAKVRARRPRAPGLHRGHCPPHAGGDVERQGRAFIAGGSARWGSHCGGRLAASYQPNHVLLLPSDCLLGIYSKELKNPQADVAIVTTKTRK